MPKVKPMKSELTFACLLTAFATVAMAVAPDKSLVQTSGDPSVSAGKFYGYRTKSEGPGELALDKAKALAAAEHVPLVVVWSEEDCEHCNTFITQMNAAKADVASFLSTNMAVFAFFKADTPDDNVPAPTYTPGVVYDAYRFVVGDCGGKPAFPLFGFYYERSDGTVVTGGSPSGFGSRTWPEFKALYLNWLAANKIDFNYHGGEFAASGTEFDRYEAEAATTNVVVELVRDDADAEFASANRLVATWPDGTSVANDVEWTEGTVQKAVALDMAAGGAFEAGKEVVLSLLDDSGRTHSTGAIALVAGENTNVNPLWFTERTPDTLAFGEWTVDIDAATNMTAAADGDAWTLVSVQGSQWCPDCANTDANFLDLADEHGENRFRKWAASNHVALAVVDVPNYSARNGAGPEGCKSPSMFSKTAYLSRGAMRSGRPYLSRKMVSEAEAMAMRARNHFLVTTNTALGGYHRPEDTNAYRTGVPIFVLLRKDGSVASRLVRFATVSPSASDQANWDRYIARFDEMLATSGESGEIDNNHWTTAPVSLADGGKALGTICHVDTADWFELSGVSSGSLVRLHVAGEGDSRVTVSFGVVVDGVFSVFASEKNVSPKDGFTAKTELPEGERWFAGVTVANTDEGFTVDSPESTVAAYSLEMAVSPPDSDPGEIAFEASSLRVVGLAATGTVRVVRRDGGHGAATVRVFCRSMDESAASQVDWKDRVLSWDDGETGAREVDFSLLPDAGGEAGVFTLAFERLDGDAFVAADAACEVTVVNTDAPCLERAAYDVSTYATFATEAAFALLNVRPGDTQIKVAPAKGAQLPSGTRLSYDKASGNIVLSGMPKKAGEYEFVCSITLRRGGKKLEGFETTIKISVAEPAAINPKIGVKRPNQTLTLFAEADGTNFVAGTLTFAASAKNALSARYNGTEGKAISFSGNWSGFDDAGAAVATLASRGATLSAAMDVEGGLSVVLSLPDGFNWFGGALAARADWPETGVFDAFSGYYTVALPRAEVTAPTAEPSGAAILTLNMSTAASVKNGVVRFAGVLPDGSPVSGSTTIDALLEDGEAARVPVFSRSSKNVFGAALCVGADGADKWTSYEPVDTPEGTFLERELVRALPGSAAYVLHRDAAWEYRTVHGAYGSYYVPGTSPQVLDGFYADYSPGDAHAPEGAPFTLAFDDDAAADSERYGEIAAPAAGEVTAGAKTMSMARAQRVSFGFTPRTGVFRGTAKLATGSGRILSGTYVGVLTPGWVLPCECGIKAPEMPFGCGTLHFADVVGKRSVRRSMPLYLDK